jgi:predicted neuraminidase
MRGIQSLEKFDVLPPDQKLFNNCHASTLLKIGERDFLCAYMAGSREGAPDFSIWLSRCTAGHWDDPVCIKHLDGIPHWNPVLHLDSGLIYLFYKTGSPISAWVQRVSTSDDFGHTWSESREMVPEDKTPRGPVKNKLLVTLNGDWLAPSSVETDKYWDAHIDISTDHGMTWKKCPIPIDHSDTGQDHGQSAVWDGLSEGALCQNDPDVIMKWDGVIQPTLWESADGQIHALMRSTRGKIFRSDSADGGITWCPAYATGLPNNNCGIDAVRMADGTIALMYNPVPGNWSPRSPLSVSFSEDNGCTWSAPFHLETRDGEYSYPAVLAEGKDLHVSYTYNRKYMVYCHLRVY